VCFSLRRHVDRLVECHARRIGAPTDQLVGLPRFGPQYGKSRIMNNEITMPKLSDTMEEGKILRWLKHPGDTVHRGDALAEVETDKADMVLEAFDDGVLDQLKLKEGESAPVGAVIATMRAAGQATGKTGEAAPAAAAQKSNGEAPAADAQKSDGESPAAVTARPTPTPRQAQDTKSRDAKSRDTKSDDRRAEAARPELRAVRSRREAQPAAPTPEPPQMSATENGEEGDDAPPRFHPAMSAHQSAAPTAMPSPPPRAARQKSEARPEQAADSSAESLTPPTADGHKLRASPLARRAAEEAGVDIAQVHGTGPEGRVTKRDIDNFVREQQLFKFRRLVSPREGAPGSREELSKMRKTIALRMAASKREIPHFYVTLEVDMEEAVKLKKSLETTELFEEDITYNDMIVKACALALARFPRINASYQDDGITIHPNINIGVAVAVEDGLILPVIRNCEQLTLPEIAREAHKLVAKAARGAGFTTDELSGGTFTISNMGMLGVEHFAAVIVPPQAAIMAVSAIKDRPVVREGALAVGKTMMVTVSCDHRIVDGVVAGRFLGELKRFLENPASLLV
jgi:pyruvate dehydrogenase E2 component (dihydrolipoamide acetyltransferase)